MQGLKHKLLFKRTWVQFPSPTWHLTIICNSFTGTGHTPETQACTKGKHPHTAKATTWIKIQQGNEFMIRTRSQENESINPMRMTVETLMGKTNVKKYQGWRKTLRQLRYVKRKTE